MCQSEFYIENLLNLDYFVQVNRLRLNKRIVFILVFLLKIPVFAIAQEIIRYNLSDGLSDLEVTDIKENKNYLWIATSDGLNRFDGKNFKIYKRNINQKNSISGNNIESLFFDSRGLLWIGLKSGGLDVYDPRKDEFKNIKSVIDIPAPVRIISIFEDSEKNIWLGSWEQGIYQLKPVGGDSVRFTAKNHFPGYIISSFIEKPKGFVRVGSYKGFFVFDLLQKQWTISNNQNHAISQLLSAEEENAIWCSTWDSGLLKLSWDKSNPAESLTETQLNENETGSIHRILNDSKSSLYLGTWGNGLLKYNLNQQKEISQIEKINISPSFINCIFRDNFQNIWIGTFGEGLIKFNPEKNGINYFPAINKLPKPVTSLTVSAQNKILAGTQGEGVMQFDAEKNELLPLFENQLNGNFERNILSFHSFGDLLFIGHDGHGIFYSNAKNNEFYKINNYTEIEKVTSVYAAQNGTTWIGTKQNGLVSFTINPDTFVPTNYKYYAQIGHDRITGIIPYKNNMLFISSNNGLLLFNKETGRIENNDTIISNEPVYTILKDSVNHVLWIGTSTNLLSCNLEKTDSVFPAFPEMLIPRGAIRTLLTDSDNNLWFSVAEKLFCRTQNDRKLKEINPGLLNKNVILSGTSVKIKGVEKLIFGTSEDLMIIEPHLLLHQTDESKIILTQLEIDNRIINVGDKLYGDIVLSEASEYINSLQLSHKCRWISLSFVESGWGNFKTNYQFRIKGFSDNWQFINLANPVVFSQLLPGSYTLEIRSFDYGIGELPGWSLNLTVTPPWWKTRSSQLLFILAFLLAATLLYLYIYKTIQRRHSQKLIQIEKEKQQELLYEKESFFTGLSHDLLTTFSLILAPVNDLIRDNKQSGTIKEKLEIIKRNTSFLSDLFGAIFDFKRAEFSDKELKENTIELNSFVNFCVHAFEYLALSRNIKLIYLSCFETLQVKTDNVKLERIIYNLLSNAIKYTPDNGEVTVHLDYSESEKSVTLNIKDNGIGMDIKNQHLIFDKFYRETKTNLNDEPKGLGLGLYIVKKFVSIMGGTISVDSALNKGTLVTVNLPVNVVQVNTETDDLVVTHSFSNEKSTILVVEDNKQLLEYTTSKLKTFFNVISASDGSEAMHIIENYVPEIIITDIIMPGLDGLSLTKKIKEDSRFSDIFVVILSAKASTDDELTGYKQGADIYLKKPIDLEVLLSQMINIDKTRQNRKSQLYAELISKDQTEINFDSKENFLRVAMQIVEKHLMEADFNLDEFASEMNISKSVLHRKFKLLVGQTPNQFMRLVRLRKSVEKLQNSDLSISEIAYLTGFSQSHYFIKCFREVYNETPKNFRLNFLKSPKTNFSK